MATLSNPKLAIKLISGTNNADVTASVNVALTAFEENLVKDGLKFVLRCKLRGDDSGFTGADDDLYGFLGKTVLADGTRTFQTTLSRNALDEDWGKDEVYARFTLQSTEPAFPLVIAVNSSSITGSF